MVSRKLKKSKRSRTKKQRGKVKELVLEKRSFAVPLSFYETINFISPAAMEIVFEAYEVDLGISVSEQQDAVLKFSEEWFQQCIEISCSGFWADLETSLERISKD